MKQSQKELDTKRYYEITKVERGGVWYEPFGSDKSVIGTIVQPTKPLAPAMKHNTYHIIVGSSNGYLRAGTELMMSKLTLRPLTIKEQEKVDATRQDAT